MGGRPKCLLRVDGESILSRLLGCVARLGLQLPVVVSGAFANEVEAEMAPGCALVIRNGLAQADQLSSLRLGLQATQPQAQAILVLLADQPLIGVAELLDLIQAYQNRPAGAVFVQPSFEGLPGNPVMFSALLRDQVLAAHPRMSPKAWVERQPLLRYDWSTTNPRYRVDLDTPDDILALQERFGVSVMWPV